jgi:hypothetical protein
MIGRRLELAEVSAARLRFWPWVDSSVALWLALPPTAAGFISVFYRVNGWFGGTAQPPAFAPIHWFFVCLSGALVGLWVLTRLAWPTPRMAFADVLGRIWVSGLLIGFVVFADAPRALLLFVVTEMAGAIAQWRALRPRWVPRDR